MNLLAILLLGHLIADFPLQTNWVYRLKNHHWAGVLLHAVIHCVVTAVLLQDTLAHWPMLIALGSIHFATDWLKLRVEFPFQSLGFILDQITHVLALLLLATWQSEMIGALTPTLIHTAVGYALVPALLMFSSVMAADLEKATSDPSSRAKNKAARFILLSQVAGLPLVVGTMIVRLSVP